MSPLDKLLNWIAVLGFGVIVLWPLWTVALDVQPSPRWLAGGLLAFMGYLVMHVFRVFWK